MTLCNYGPGGAENSKNKLNHLMVLLSKKQCEKMLNDRLIDVIVFAKRKKIRNISIHIPTLFKKSITTFSFPSGTSFSINHQKITKKDVAAIANLEVNLIFDYSHSQKEAFCSLIERGEEDRLVNVDLIVSFREGELNLEHCMPWIIGFAEIAHHPFGYFLFLGLTGALEQSVEGFYRCKQNFGK